MGFKILTHPTSQSAPKYAPRNHVVQTELKHAIELLTREGGAIWTLENGG